jgi:hypothetical protein
MIVTVVHRHAGGEEFGVRESARERTQLGGGKAVMLLAARQRRVQLPQPGVDRHLVVDLDKAELCVGSPIFE